MKNIEGLFILVACISTSYGQPKVAAEEALTRLKDNNQRFVIGKSIRPRQDITRVKEVASWQAPFATIVGCSDSRVPNEIIFDHG